MCFLGESKAPEYVEAETKELGIPEVVAEASGDNESVTVQNANIPADSKTKESTETSNGNSVTIVEEAIEPLETKEVSKESESSKHEDSNDIKDSAQETAGTNNEEVSTKENITKIEDQIIKSSGNGQDSISASNLNAIQELEESDEEDPSPNEGDTGIPSLDVTIAIEDTLIESQNTTQDLQTNIEKQKGIHLSIKVLQALRAKALSRLANIDPSPVRTRTNTPLDYNSPGLPWNVDLISIEQFTQLTEFFWGECSDILVVKYN